MDSRDTQSFGFGCRFSGCEKNLGSHLKQGFDVLLCPQTHPSLSLAKIQLQAGQCWSTEVSICSDCSPSREASSPHIKVRPRRRGELSSRLSSALEIQAHTSQQSTLDIWLPAPARSLPPLPAVLHGGSKEEGAELLGSAPLDHEVF